MSGKKTLHIIISGKVQGVFYRATARDRALQLSITGWVRNMPDGKVEMMASGTPGNIEKFVSWCRQGPPKARVDEVIIKETNPDFFESFNIERGN